MRVAINGAGIAGTALAYWLYELGHEVLLVERAPELRTGGYVLNLWGVGYDAMEKMGLLPKMLEQQYETDELRMVEVARWCGGRIGSEAKASDHTDVAYWIDIPTLEGVMKASPGDYIIKGVQGEFYPCKADIFEATYERMGVRGE